MLFCWPRTPKFIFYARYERNEIYNRKSINQSSALSLLNSLEAVLQAVAKGRSRHFGGAELMKVNETWISFQTDSIVTLKYFMKILTEKVSDIFKKNFEKLQLHTRQFCYSKYHSLINAAKKKLPAVENRPTVPWRPLVKISTLGAFLCSRLSYQLAANTAWKKDKFNVVLNIIVKIHGVMK